MRHRVGLHIAANGFPENDVIELTQRINASSYLVMDDDGLAQRMHDANNGEAIIVSRTNWGWPDDWPPDAQNMSLADMNDNMRRLVDTWARCRNDYPDVYKYFPNEPTALYDGLVKLLDSFIYLMGKCEVNDIKAVIGNFAWSKNLYQTDVDAGMWDNFIRAASRWTNQGFGYIGGHDYTSGLLPWGCGGLGAQNLYNINPDDLHRDNWTTWHDIWNRPNWHMFRWVMLAKRAKLLGVPMFKIILTECFWDRMTDLINKPLSNKNNQTIMQWLDSEAQAHVRGLKTHRNLYRKWFPNRTPEDVILEQLQWCEDTYPDYVEGFNIFAYSKNAEWFTHFDVSNESWGSLVDSFADITPNEDEVPDSVTPALPVRQYNESSGTTQRVRISPAGDFNVMLRMQPDTKNNLPIGRIESGKWYCVNAVDYPAWEVPAVDGRGNENGFVPISLDGVDTIYISKEHIRVIENDADPTVDESIALLELRVRITELRLHKSGIR